MIPLPGLARGGARRWVPAVPTQPPATNLATDQGSSGRLNLGGRPSGFGDLVVTSPWPRCGIGPMGLCINWTVHALPTASSKDATTALTRWRQACLDLPFEEVTELVHFDAPEIKRRLDDRADQHRWFLIQACTYAAVDAADPDAGSVSIEPIEVIGFTAYPGDECEPMNCFLARYPESARLGGLVVRPAISGWAGSSFCKTQYASGVAPAHFLKCHLTVTAALDAAKGIGLLESVTDEGEFWSDRDHVKLLKTVDRWNAGIAAFVGSMQDALGIKVAAPIKSHPGFERLEHLGGNGDTAAFARAIAAALKGSSPSTS